MIYRNTETNVSIGTLSIAGYLGAGMHNVLVLIIVFCMRHICVRNLESGAIKKRITRSGSPPLRVYVSSLEARGFVFQCGTVSLGVLLS